MSQSAVSHALARLRALFGDALFLRRSYGLEPTRHALDLAPRVEELLAAMAGALGLATAFDAATTTRRFRIAAPDHLTTLLAPPLLSAFLGRAPKARFAFSQLLGEQALAALERDEIDLVLGRFGSRIEGFVVERIFDDRLCLIARRRHPRLRQGLTRALYAELDHVQISIAGDFRSLEVEPPGQRAVERRIVAAVPRFNVAFAVVSRTDAVALAPRRLALAQADDYGLSLHEVPFRLDPIRMLAVRRQPLDLGTRWLLEQVKLALEL
jgi:DNA-binding transcriptional LysR family regulator